MTAGLHCRTEWQAEPPPLSPLAKGGSGRMAFASRIAVAVTLVALGCPAWLPAADGKAPVFNRDIRPILSGKCFKCHGPDKIARKADLRLDQREAAISADAIVPGQPGESLLIERIFSDDSKQVMPPPNSGQTLSAEQKDTLRRWVAAGAEYQSHSSLIPVPKRVSVPAVKDGSQWIRNPIDAFVLERLQEAKIEPAAEVSREKWLRRASFDLTGLPPTIEEIDAFLADQSADAYKAVVDRLLKSPAFGERMASDWLDAARYAAAFGYH